MTSSTPDLPSYRDPMPDEGHEALRRPLAAAIDDLAETVALLAENQAGVQDSYFLSDVLFELLGQAMSDLAACQASNADLVTRIAKLEHPPTVAVHL